ncbi:single-stranded DNA-binding protein [Cellulosimicrobium funkei]|nr:single-stranded DNA-binding protein [Cellulosimicrobium funkei]
MGKKTVQGNLTGDPRHVRSKSGQELVVMTVAENGRRFNEESRAWEDTEAKFYGVAMDRSRLGENVLASLHKGDRVTVSGNYQVGAYSTSTGEPGLNHRIWAEDVAASMQFNPVVVLPRDRTTGVTGAEQGPGRDVGQSVDRQSVDQGVQPSEVTQEAFAAWAAQQPAMVPHAQQRAGVSR